MNKNDTIDYIYSIKLGKIKALQFKIIHEMSSAEDALIRINRSVKGLNLFKNFKNIFMFI